MPSTSVACKTRFALPHNYSDSVAVRTLLAHVQLVSQELETKHESALRAVERTWVTRVGFKIVVVV